ncbi:MAG: sulfatase-like hydrolase/transferase [bacterium]|nr:sulfatase-like hydrolase/transferase [bacterium]
MKRAPGGPTPDGVLPAAALLAATLCLFGPLFIYYTNLPEYPFFARDIIPHLAVAALFCASLIFLLTRLLPPGQRRRIAGLLIAISYLLWIQGNIIGWWQGVLDGSEIRWEALRLQGVLDGALWIAVCAAALLGSRFLSRTARGWCAALSLVQALGLVHLIYESPKELSSNGYWADTRVLPSFSPENNVILIVPDGFQNDLFQSIIGEDSRHRDVFDGFTFFRNALGGFPMTNPSVPLMMTGLYYDNTVPIQTFIRSAYHSRSLPTVLKENGYQVHVTNTAMRTFEMSIASNTKIQPWRALVNMNNLAHLYDVTLLRYLPTAAKRRVWTGYSGLIERWVDDYMVRGGKGDLGAVGPALHREVGPFEEMILRADARFAQPTFKYFHVMIPGWPFTLNERLEYEEMPWVGASYRRQAIATLRLLEKYLGVLRDIGVYDNSMIVIAADHGQGYQFPPTADMLQRCAGDGDAGRDAERMVMALGHPLVLVKPPRATGRMRVSDAPVTLGDIPKTVADILELDADFPGRSMLDVAEGERRERRFFYHVDGPEWGRPYLSSMREFVVSGMVWCPAAWRRTGRMLLPGGDGAGMYSPGTAITFGEHGTYKRYQMTGWEPGGELYSFIEHVHLERRYHCLDVPIDVIPGIAGMPSLVIPVTRTEAGLGLRATLAAFDRPGGPPAGTVELYVNGSRTDVWHVTGSWREYASSIPGESTAGGILTIALDVPGEAGADGERDVPRIAIRSLTLSEE